MTDDKTEFVSIAYSCDNVHRENITSLFAVRSSLICTFCYKYVLILFLFIGLGKRETTTCSENSGWISLRFGSMEHPHQRSTKQTYYRSKASLWKTCNCVSFCGSILENLYRTRGNIINLIHFQSTIFVKYYQYKLLLY